MRNMVKVMMTLGVIFLAVFVAYGLVVTAPVPKQVEAREVARTIRVVAIQKRQVQLTVRSQGTVSPRTESQLIPEVSGRVQWISPNLVAGGFVEQDEILLKIDDRDYRSTVASNQASVSRAKAEDEHARFELKRQRELVKKKLTSQSTLEGQLRRQRIASATLKEAEIALEQAERELVRAEIKAPYDGYIRTERVDPGQFITRGQSLGSIYASETVEIRLPVADSQLAYLDLPLGVRGEISPEVAPLVALSSDYGGGHYEWQGTLVRTEAEIDARSRMVNMVVRVENQPEDDQPPLPVGLFIQARIEGRLVDSIVSLPRTALRNENQVLVVDEEKRLRFRDVDLLRFDQNQVLISGGLKEGELVNVSPIQTVIDGMMVKPVMDGET